MNWDIFWGVVAAIIIVGGLWLSTKLDDKDDDDKYGDFVA